MANVTVFVDDAVLGRLPACCAREGVPTDGQLVVRTAVGGEGLGVWWLLLLAGPPGWIGLLVVLWLRSPASEVLRVCLPWSDEAAERVARAHRSTRTGRWITGAGGLVVLVGVVAVGPPLVLLGVLGLVAGLVVVGAGTAAHRRALVGVELDASRRWVTLRGVHPTFQARCLSQPRLGTAAPAS